AAADRVHAGRGHVDRTEPAMRGEIWRAELRRPEPGQRLALIAAGEEGELFRVVRADPRQPKERRFDRLVPFNLAEFAGAAFADPHQGLRQFCRRLLLHDAGGALAADDATVDRVLRVALDVAD